MTRTIYVIEPQGWPCTFASCPPGFFMFQDNLFLKSEYMTNTSEGPKEDAYCDSGEYFCGGAHTKAEREALVVQPVAMIKMEIGL